MYRFLAVFLFFLLIGCNLNRNPLHQKTIVIDPGHGGTAETDHYRVGPAGEREEWINLRVALELEKLLSENGATVLLTRRDDTHINLADRAKLATENRADLFLSIHHNATADTSANFPIIYFHGYADENRAGVRLAQLAAEHLRDALFSGEGPVVVASDHTIFPTAGAAVLRETYGIPAIISEASFFTNPGEEQRLKNPDYNRLEAEALYNTIFTFFSEQQQPIRRKNSRHELPPFNVMQEAERMNPRALNWHEFVMEAKDLAEIESESAWEMAYTLATLSVQSFPDSPVARGAHLLRADLLHKLGKPDDAERARLRAEQFYPLP
ncbi:MAG: N-acetylmuramoyl-L-alanine amidase [Balneolaceae bacterium]|nr:N-acetylmuramoyl-L-alanine amidase [Balneolaceae bacterium]